MVDCASNGRHDILRYTCSQMVSSSFNPLISRLTWSSPISGHRAARWVATPSRSSSFWTGLPGSHSTFKAQERPRYQQPCSLPLRLRQRLRLATLRTLTQISKIPSCRSCLPATFCCCFVGSILVCLQLLNLPTANGKDRDDNDDDNNNNNNNNNAHRAGGHSRDTAARFRALSSRLRQDPGPAPFSRTDAT